MPDTSKPIHPEHNSTADSSSKHLDLGLHRNPTGVCVNVRMCGCVDMIGYVGAWIGGCLDVWMCGRVDMWMCGCVNVCMCGCVHAWMSGGADVWMCGIVDVWRRGRAGARMYCVRACAYACFLTGLCGMYVIMCMCGKQTLKRLFLKRLPS